MSKYSIYLFGLLLFTLFISCGGSSVSSSVDSGDVSDSSVKALAPDSVAAMLEEETEAEGKEKKMSAPATTEAQLDYMTESPQWEKYAHGILPQMAEDAPEYLQKILESNTRFIIVDKAKMKLFLYDPYGNIEKSYGIACAKNYGTKHKKGDSRTTEGIVEVKGVFDSREWLFTDDNGYTSPTRGVYGPRFIRLTIPYIGIHGTGSPGSIGRRCSHGCIRVTNDNILELVKYVEEGMPVIISPGPADMAVNQREGYNVLSVSTEPGSPKAVPGKAPVVNYTSTPKSRDAEEGDNPAEENASGETSVEGSSVSPPSSEEVAPEKQSEVHPSSPSETSSGNSEDL